MGFGSLLDEAEPGLCSGHEDDQLPGRLSCAGGRHVELNEGAEAVRDHCAGLLRVAEEWEREDATFREEKGWKADVLCWVVGLCQVRG